VQQAIDIGTNEVMGKISKKTC